MRNVLDLVADSVGSVAPRAADDGLSMDEWAEIMATMPFGAWGLNQTLVGDREEIERTYAGMVFGAYKANGVVFACAMTRSLIFSQARIVFQQLRGGQPGDLFGTPDLSIVEHPWPGATTADLLARVDLDAQFAGTSFAVRRPGRIERLRPDWVGVMIGNRRGDAHPWDPDAELLGIVYQPGGPGSGEEPMSFTADEISVYAPIPDPMCRFVGMSWLRPVINDILGDKAATRHKLAFFENGATPSMVVKSNIADTKKWREWVELFRSTHEGAARAYKTIHLQAGADATVVGANLRQLDLKATQGAGQTLIAAAAGMHPVLVALSEGLEGSSLNAGNFRAAAKSVADIRFRPWWGNLAGSLERIIPPLAGTRVWYDDQHIPFLAEDVKDAAEVVSRNMLAMESGIRSGFTPASIVDAVTSGDLRRLKHTGLFSVQLQPPGAGTPDQAIGSPAAAATYVPVMLPQFATVDTPSPLPRAVGQRQAVRDFWPVSGQLTAFGSVSRGTLLEAGSPHVAAFPSLFTDATDDLGTRVRRLKGEGLSVPAIAAQVDRSERQVWRLLGSG